MVRVDVDRVDAKMGFVHAICAINNEFMWCQGLYERADLFSPLIRNPHVAEYGSTKLVAGLVCEYCRVCYLMSRLP